MNNYILQALAVGGMILTGPVSAADSLKDTLENLVSSHKRMNASNADVEAARQNAKAAMGDWYPTLSITASIGHETQNKPADSVNTHYVPREVDAKLTQQLWDFGSSNSAIRSAGLTLEQTTLTRDATRQNLILEGLVAYLNVVRANKLMGFAKGSADNIKRQAELEDARVSRGSGFSTDVLQAKTQLAGAEAKLIQTRGALRSAVNRYRAVFGAPPEDISKLRIPTLPLELLPQSLESAIEETFKSNPQIHAAELSAKIAEEAIVKTRADEFLPTLNAVAEHISKKDKGGTLGNQHENLFKIEYSHSFNLGLTAVNTLKASEQSHISSVNTYGDTRDQIEEQVRNGWDSLETARDNAGYLKNQADIASEFLELARKERKLGNRSLIDVLSGETALINASSDATSAETDVAIAVFSLLGVTGKLESSIFQ